MNVRANKSGLGADVQRKIESNYDEAEGAKCLSWIQMLTGVSEIASNRQQVDGAHDSFYEVLHNGTVLCKLIDSLMPGKVKWNDRTFQSAKIPAMQLMREKERIALFNNLVQEYGVSDTYVFPTDSLHDKGVLNLSQVCTCIRGLGIEAQAKPGYTGPADYWPKKVVKNQRSFTQEQLKAGEGMIGLQAGSNKGASQAGMTMGKQRMIID